MARVAFLTLSCLVGCFLFQGAGTEVLSQELLEPSLTTDRPGVGDTAYLLPKGYVQFEGGLIYQHDRVSVPSERTTTVSTPNMLLRFGLLDGMELRLSGGQYVYEKTGSGNVTDHDHGVSAPIIGAKLQLTEDDAWPLQMAAIFNLTLPYGSKNLHPDDVTPAFKVAGNYTLSERVTWEANLGGAWEDGVNAITGFYTTALYVSLMDTIVSFAEFFGNMNGPSTHAFDAGVTYLWLPTLQFDVWGGPGLTDAANDWFIAAGVSYRFPQVWD